MDLEGLNTLLSVSSPHAFMHSPQLRRATDWWRVVLYFESGRYSNGL
jgi:hypothetical protein